MSSYYLEPDGYPDRIFLAAVEQTLKCSICLHVLKDAVRCSNEHSFCKGCLEKLLVSNRRNGTAPCPHCREMLDKNAKPARTANGFINRLEVRCYTVQDMEDKIEPPIKKSKASIKSPAKQALDCCDWTGCLDGLEAHMAVCDFDLIGCDFEGCMKRVERRNIKDHKLSCPKRPVQCELCWKRFPPSTDLTEHKSVCPRRGVTCPNAECGEEIEFEDLEEHRAECLMEEIDCTLKPLMGCSFRCLRQHMVTHVNDTSIHFAGLAKALADTLKQLKQGKASVSYKMAIPDFDVNEEYQSPTFLAFGHTFLLTFHKATQQFQGKHCMHLIMVSRVPARIGYTFIVGHLGKEYRHTCHSKKRIGNPCNYSNDAWGWGINNMVVSSDLTRDKLLTKDGTLYIEAIVKEARSEGIWNDGVLDEDESEDEEEA